MNPPATEIQLTLDDIFQTVCDLPPDRRGAYLEEVCVGNDELRRQVENLLRHHDADSGFLETPAVSEVFEEIVKIEKENEEPRQPMIGRQIGNYRVSALLGRGGMGEVYLARDAELGVDVVIKLLREEFKDDPEWMARFNREGRLNAELNHPNIAGIRYKGEVDGRQFLVFEFVAGETLESRLKKGALPVKDALPLFSQLAEALGFAHSKGIIHRDLKPANLMLTPDGQMKVLDFGIAKKVTADLTTIETLLPEDELTNDFGKTRRGEVMGTVVYMSPEQTRGEPLDYRTDLWSFGCVLYETLSGKRPFGGVDVYDTLNVIRTAEPDWEVLPAETPDSIRELLQRCLKKKPYQRLASAGEAKSTINELISPSPKMSLRRKALIVAALLILLTTSAIGGAWLSDWLKRSAIPAEKQFVVLPFKGFGDELAGIGFAEELRRNLSSISDDWQASPPPESAATSLLSLDIQNVANKLGANLIVGGDARQTGDQITIKFWIRNSYLYLLREAEVSGPRNQLPELQNRIARQVAERLSLKTSPRAEAFSVQLKLQHADASEKYLVAIADLQREPSTESTERPIEILTRLIATEGDSPRFQQALARAYLNKYVFTEDRKWLNEALQACSRAIDLAGNQSVAYQVTRGLINVELGNTDEALRDFNDALAISPKDWEALNGLAMANKLSSKFSEAEQAYNRAISLWPRYWDGYNELGNFYYDQANYDKAIEIWLRVTELLPNGAVGYNNLAGAYLQVGREADAFQAYQASLNKDRSGDNLAAYNGLGTIYFDRQQYLDAASYFEKSIELAQRSGRPQAILVANLGDTYRQLARIEPSPNLAEEYKRRENEAYDQAIKIAFLQETRESQINAALSEWLAKRGRTAEALKQIAPTLKAESRSAEMDYSATLVFALAGDTERALVWLEKAVCGGFSITRLEKDPELESLRANFRYQAIIDKCRQNNR
jgi:serine/threonine protein kinase/tetratricopeptide (TPR) repeat protein